MTAIVLFLLGLSLIGGKHLKEIAAQLQQAIDNFRGGGRPPSHPLPANDSRILNRKRAKPQNL